MSAPHQVIIDALVNVQLKPLDDAIADVQKGIAECRQLAGVMNQHVERYEQMLVAMITKRNELLATIIAKATV